MRKDIQIALILTLSIATCSCQLMDKKSDKVRPSEQLALDVFKDSVLFKPIWKERSSENEIIEIPSNSVDSLWIDNGVFYGYKVYINEYAIKLSRAYIDTLTFIANENIFTDSAKNEIIGFWKYRAENLRSTAGIKLIIPDSLTIGTFDDFIKRKSRNEIYIQVNKAISSKTTEVVEIKAYKHGDKYTPLNSFTFWLFVDKKTKKVKKWSFL